LINRILFISVMKGAPWGGSEEFWYRLAIYMAKQGYKVDCCFFDWRQGKQEKKAALKAGGCTLHLLPNPAEASGYLHKLLIKARVKNQLKKQVKQKYQLVCISQGAMLDVTYPLFNSMLPHLKNFVLLYHNFNPGQVISTARKQSFYKWSHAAVKNFVASKKILAVVKSNARFNLPHAQVLINPISIPVQPKPYQWPPLDDEGNFIFVVTAQLDVERKAQDILIKILAASKWVQRNWQLHLYGEGPDAQVLAGLIISLNLQQKVFLKGHTANVQNVLSKAHLLLQITHIDAMPLSVAEAMNMARPCVVSHTGDMPLWILDGQQGYVVPHVSEAAIDEVLEKAWQQKENWQQMGINAFEMFHKKYPIPYEPFYTKIFADLMKD